MQKLSFIGAGNVAYKLGLAFRNAGYQIEQVYSQTLDHASQTAEALGADPVDQLKALSLDGDAFIIAVPDDAIADVAQQWNAGNRLVMHTSGMVSMDVLGPCSTHYGVLYPLQTINASSEIDWGEVPVCVEGNTTATEQAISALAGHLSNRVNKVDSQRRAVLHLSAVLTNNFTNHLLHMASDLLKAQNLPFDLLQPLAQETIDKAFKHGPEKVQTGPAMRGDVQTMQKHLELLPDQEQKQLYQLLSKLIQAQDKRET